MASGTIVNTWVTDNIIDSVTKQTQRSYNIHFPANTSNLNDFGVNNWFIISKYGQNTDNAPTTAAGMVLSFEYTSNQGVQLAIQSQDTNIYIRSKSSGSWGNWKIFQPST